jgi:hypothetical protein
MKRAGSFVVCIMLLSFVLAAGCSSDKKSDVYVPTIDPNTRFSPSNVTFTNYGFSFEYPENLIVSQYGMFGEKNATWENGEIQLKQDTGDNITITWMKMHRVPPNIPLIYEGLWSSSKKDPRFSDVKIYNLQTYPNTTCGDATFIGRMTFFNKERQVQTNEGILIWYHASQDRLYYIDIATAEDYYLFIKGNLERYRESFVCTNF